VKPHILSLAGAATSFMLALPVAAAVPSPAPVASSASATSISAVESPQQVPIPQPCSGDTVPVLVEPRLARVARLQTGDPLRVSGPGEPGGCPAVVAGVFDPLADPARLAADRPRVLLHLPHLAGLTGRRDEVDRFSVRLRADGSDTDVAAKLGAILPGAQALPTATVSERSSTTFAVVSRFHRAIALITIGAGGVFLACIMTLKVQERRSHVAALRLIGVSRRTLLGWVIAEAAVVAVLGGVLGLGVGAIATAIINAYYRGVYETALAFAMVTPETIWLAIALAVVLGLAAGVIAAFHLLSRDALEEVER
jgi:putative ABC transport system permease protein